MSANFVAQYQNGIDFALMHCKKFLAICNDEVWKEKNGGWPVGLQYYHALGATGMLLGSITNKKIENPVPEGGNLAGGDQVIASKEQAAQFLANIQAAVDNLSTSLTDAELLEKNEMVSKVLGRDATNAAVLELIAIHMVYHLGSCDAALRNHGLEGSW